MRQEPNNGIDLLLRQMGRREETLAADLDGHLDADELNSYVANALPARTRARYTLHLADCSSCRMMVAQLSAAEGVAPVRQPAVEPSGWKSFLASFFSPMVLRYAVPALGVIAIAVLGIVMLPQRQSHETNNSVARVTNTDPGRPVSESAPASTPTPAQPEQGPRAGIMADGPAPAPPPAKAAPAEEAERQPEPEKKAAPAAEKDAARDAMQPHDTAARADQEPKQELKKEKQQEVLATAPATITTPGNAAPQPQSARTGEGAGAGGVASAPASRAESRRSRAFNYTESRSVAGREFRKQGNVWIDAAYNSSQSTTIVTRGTEQYRALVADEPEIHTIAETLGSEFVVVWKGRAYRVR